MEHNPLEKNYGKEDVKTPVYWDMAYAEPLTSEDVAEMNPERRVSKVIYVGEFTDAEWRTFIKNARRDSDNEPIVTGKRIDENGDPLEDDEE